jgi:hypothetical protein
VAAIEALCKELGYPDADGGPSEDWLRSGEAKVWGGGDGSFELAEEVREALARLAYAAQRAGDAEDEESPAVRAALDGAELLMRREIAMKRESAIGEHLPSFAFLVVIPALGRAGAMEISRRAEELLDGGG